MGVAQAPLDDELRQLLTEEESLRDAATDVIAALDWPAARGAGADVPSREAGMAARLLAEYLRLNGRDSGVEVESVLIDVVSALMHLADALVVNFAYVLELAQENAETERED